MKRQMRRNDDTATRILDTKPSEGRVSLMIVPPDAGSKNRVIRCYDVDSCYEVLDVESKSADDMTIFVMQVYRDGIWLPIRRWAKDHGLLRGLRY